MRLRLDFTIPDAVGRQEFLRDYLQTIEQKGIRLTDEELEMCGNYLLWGRDIDGKNEVQHKNVYINSKNSPWTTEPDHDSLDALLEIPTFNENSIRWPHQTQYTTPKETFSREEALQSAPAFLIPTFENLFNSIDRTELIINFYELGVGKRKNQPRSELLEKFSDEELENIRAAASCLNNYSYLKKRHSLVELRRQQYTLKDSYKPVLFFENGHDTQIAPDPIRFGADIPVLPLGLRSGDRKSLVIFQDLNKLNVELDEEDLKLISNQIWSQNTSAAAFDFQNLEHVYQLFMLYFEVKEEVDRNTSDVDSSLKALLDTLSYYIDFAELTDIQREILQLKVQKKKNLEIAAYINKKYGKTYTDNYISTIFRQKIIRAINEVAAYHLLIMENIFFPEEFKKCNTCGRLLLKDSHNFVRKARAKDGYTNRCKDCDRDARKAQKEKH